MARVARRTITTGTPSLAVPGSLTAAARRVTLATNTPTGGASAGDDGWKSEAWQRFDEVGELRAVCQWFAGSLSRVRLVASDIDPATGQPTGTTEDQLAATTVTDIAGGPAGQAAMLSRLAVFLTVPGEGWVAILTRRPDSTTAATEEWHILADDEIKNVGGRVAITLPDGTNHELDATTDSLFRIWNPHPRHTQHSDSPVRAALSILREIRRCEQTIEAAARSRVAGNGILAVPTEISLPSTAVPTPEPEPDAPGIPPAPQPVDRPITANELMSSLQQAMSTAIADQASAAAMVPIVLKAPGEHLDKIKHITLASDVTDTAVKTRETAIRRLALSLDVPPEVLLGVADSNHWSGWLMQDQAVNQHIAPMMVTICDALTTAVLRPLLEASGHPDPESVVVWFDLAALAQRPDRSADAQAAYDAGAISQDTYRREMGFGDDDAARLDDETQRRDLMMRLLVQTPALYPYLCEALGLPSPAAASMLPVPTTGRPSTRLLGQPTPDTGEQ